MNCLRVSKFSKKKKIVAFSPRRVPKQCESCRIVVFLVSLVVIEFALIFDHYRTKR